jgi:hypothetical protein
MNSSRVAKIVLNCRENGRRGLGEIFGETLRLGQRFSNFFSCGDKFY